MAFPYQQFIAALTQVGPMLLPLIPGGAVIAPFVPTILKTIADAEKKPGATGAEKRAYVQQIVAGGVEIANRAKPGSVDGPLVVEASGHYVDAIVTSINAVRAAKVAMPQVAPIVEATTPLR